MSSPHPPGNGAEPDGQVLPQRVAELAGELTEAREESRRKRLARQLTQLASRGGGESTAHGVASRTGAVWRGTQTGAGTAWRRVQSATGSAARRARPARDAAGQRVLSGRDAATRRAQATRDAARTGARASGSATVRLVRASGQWLTAQTLEMAPRVPIRSLATLREQHPGLDTEQLADLLIGGAARASAGIGAAVGAAAAVPFVPTLPMELGVETLALVAVELKLIAELHEVYGKPAPGATPQRMMAYLTAWSQRRGVRLTSNGVSLAVGSPVRRQLERRLLAKAGQSALALAPLLTGVAAGAAIDHHETRRLGRIIRADLRKSAAPDPG
jgi:hypothetical protein